MRFILFLISTLAIAGDFTSSLGDTYQYMISAITTDSAGNTYVVGSRAIGGAYFTGVFTGVPLSITTIGSFFLAGGSDVFVSKLDPNGQLLFTDTFAGKGVDTGTAIALDPSGNIYIAGTTTSNDFPLSKALQTQPSAYGSGLVMKLSNDGSTILYSTYFGGMLGQSAITSLATDAKGNLYLTGYTQASDFPHTAGMPFGQITQSPASPGVILASISAAGDKILYSGAIVGGTPCTSNNSTCINNGPGWEGVGIGVDAAGNAYVAGNFQSTNLPTTPGVLAPNGAGAFVVKINVGGAGLGYLTYVGSAFLGDSHVLTALNAVSAIAVDAAGNVYLAGASDDPHFPATPGSYEPTGQGGFLAKLNPSGSAMVWATYLGASPQSIAIDAGGNVWASGTISGSAFPNVNGWATGPEFLAQMNAEGSKLTYSALYPTGTVAQSVALDPSGLVHVSGGSGFVSAINPNAAPSMKIFDFGNAFGGASTARIAPGEVISIYGPGIGPATAASAAPVNGFYPKTFSGVQVQINGMNMPLLYVSANQINAVVPMGLTTGAGATVRVIDGTAVSPAFPVWLVPSAPQAFPTALNQDGTLNSKTNPAKGGSTITFYATGWPSNFQGLADGQIATTALDSCEGACQVSATTNVYSPTATVTYGGVAPGIVAGVTQFNVKIGAIPTLYGTFLFNFLLTGPASVTESVWVAP